MQNKTQFALAFLFGLAAALSFMAWLKRSGQQTLIPFESPSRALAASSGGAAGFIREPASTPRSSGGAYAITWDTLDGGGGTAAGGAGDESYQLGYTLSQPDAGERLGGNYSLQGGYWPGAIATWQNYLPMLQR